MQRDLVRGAYVEGYRVGGKTGTAQKVKDGRYMENNYIVSFIGFAPADDPQVVIYVAVDNPKGTVQFGGVVAAPIVGNMMRDILPAIGVQPRTGGIDKELTWLETPSVEVPNLIGMTKKKDLQTQQVDLEIEVQGEGEKVVEQQPRAGVKVKAGTKIRLYLGS
ncbi:hypothetical protein GCM10020331_045570 [Ectobacillus funiculus]